MRLDDSTIVGTSQYRGASSTLRVGLADASELGAAGSNLLTVAPGGSGASPAASLAGPPAVKMGLGSASLGTTAKFVRGLEHYAQKNRTSGGLRFNRSVWLAKVLSLQRVAAKLLLSARDRELAGQGFEGVAPTCKAGYHRVLFCLWSRWAENVTVKHSTALRRAAYKGLVTCGSWSACPVCSARITEHRRSELQKAVELARGRGCVLALGSLTLRHSRGDRLGELLGELQGAFNGVVKSKGYGELVKRYGIVDQGRPRLRYVVATENTWGYNGHHPHRHPLFFLAPGSDVEAFQLELRDLWYRYTDTWEELDPDSGELLGRPFDEDRWEHGCTVTDNGGKVAEYVAKFGHLPRWDLPEELAKANSKHGRGGFSRHFNMWELLSEFSESGRPELGAAWVEFAQAFKGTHQVRWSPGLRDWLGMGRERSDEELVGDLSEYERDLVSLGPAVWELVRSAGRRGELLAVAGDGDQAAVLAYLERLRNEVKHGCG